MQLHDPGLLRQQAFIDGAWVAGTTTFEVADPASGEVLARIPDLGANETRRAIDAANAIIVRNTCRKPKRLWTDAEPGPLLVG